MKIPLPPLDLFQQWRRQAPVCRDAGATRGAWLIKRAIEWASEYLGSIEAANVAAKQQTHASPEIEQQEAASALFFKAELAKLVCAVGDFYDKTYPSGTLQKRLDSLRSEKLKEQLNFAKVALSKQGPDASEITDGHHTFSDLYEHRHALCLALMRSMPGRWWLSRRHSDGGLCFGSGEWFIVGATLPSGWEITYHMPSRLWELAFKTGATELQVGRPWDGHTPQEVVDHLKRYATMQQSPAERASASDLSGVFELLADRACESGDLCMSEEAFLRCAKAANKFFCGIVGESRGNP